MSVLDTHPVFCSVTPLYAQGIQTPQPALLGQVFTERIRGVLVVNLWQLHWTETQTDKGTPLAVLWNPLFCGATYDSFIVSGLEAWQQGQVRRWYAQKWLCEVLDSHRARARNAPHVAFGELAHSPLYYPDGVPEP